MQFPIEWDKRLDMWVEQLSHDIYTPVAPLEWTGFVTSEELGYPRAMAEGDFQPVPEGTRWGHNWEYLWVRTTLTVPESAAGEKLVLRLDLGGESAVYVDGKEFGCRRAEWVKDDLHRMSDLVLTESAVPGTSYEVAVEVYAGHDFPGCRRGPQFAETPAWQPDDARLRTVTRHCSFGRWNELAYQLYLDVRFLRSARRGLFGDTLHKQDINEALKQFTLTVDFEQPAADRNADYQKAREALAPILARHNGSTAPQFYAFGHAHIDVAWLWPLAETERKVHRTFAAQVAHMDRYPGYKFLQSQPHLYRMAKELYPDLYARIKEKVAAGQWIPEGGMWVEADTNVSGGEALIRQFVHGKRFFREEFGVDNKMLWLPDVFGYNAALPQIMKGCGIEWFSTQKIWWAYNGGEQFPYNDFYWQGLDGTAIRTFLHVSYTSDTDAETMGRRWNDRRQKYGLRGFMIPFGYGDGGGGPTREHIENVLRQKDFEGLPRMDFAHPNDYFENTPEPTDTYVGELYLQCHRGVQTSQAKVKWGNRKCELALRETEALGVLAKQAGYTYPLAAIDEHWKQVLLCQFHDILPGSSIHRVYEEAYKTHTDILNALADVRLDMGRALCDGSEAVSVFNSLSFDRVVLADLPEGWDGAEADGRVLTAQELNGRMVAAVTVPAMGSVTLQKAAGVAPAVGTVSAALTADGAEMSNGRLTVRFNRRGEMVSAVTASGEMLCGLGNELKMFKDTTVAYEAWDIDTSYELLPVELTEDADMEIVSQGALAACLRITRRIHNSDLTQLVTLRADSDRVDFDTTVEWNEAHKLLKVCFDVDVHAEEAISEIQFGHIARPNHRSRPYDLDRYEVAQHRWTALCEGNRGVAILNDCKYGVNTMGTSINVSLLRAPQAPDETADLGTQHFIYSFLPFDCALADSDVVREAYDLNCPATPFAGAWAQASAVTVAAKNVFIDTMKPAEDGSDDVILRLYEAMGLRTDTTLSVALPFAAVESCNMLEEDGTPVAMDGTAAALRFRPYEIKTIRVKAK